MPRPPQNLRAYMAYSPLGVGDIDLIRLSKASCQSAVSNLHGIFWRDAERQGWTIGPIMIVPAEAVAEIPRTPPRLPPPPGDELEVELIAAERTFVRPAPSPRPRVSGSMITRVGGRK